MSWVRTLSAFASASNSAIADAIARLSAEESAEDVDANVLSVIATRASVKTSKCFIGMTSMTFAASVKRQIP